MPALPNSEGVQCLHIKVDTQEPVFELSELYIEMCNEKSESSSMPSSSSPGKFKHDMQQVNEIILSCVGTQHQA